MFSPCCSWLFVKTGELWAVSKYCIIFWHCWPFCAYKLVQIVGWAAKAGQCVELWRLASTYPPWAGTDAKTDLYRVQRKTKKKKAAKSYCPVTNAFLPDKTVVVMHLFKQIWRDQIDMVGIEHIHDSRNGLPVWIPVEWAFNSSRWASLHLPTWLGGENSILTLGSCITLMPALVKKIGPDAVLGPTHSFALQRQWECICHLFNQDSCWAVDETPWAENLSAYDSTTWVTLSLTWKIVCMCMSSLKACLTSKGLGAIRRIWAHLADSWLHNSTPLLALALGTIPKFTEISSFEQISCVYICRHRHKVSRCLSDCLQTFSACRMCFIYDKFSDSFISKLLDPALRPIKLSEKGKALTGPKWLEPEGNLQQMTYGDLDGKALEFVASTPHRPFKRVLNFQARQARNSAIDKGWISNVWDFEDFLEEGLSATDKVEQWLMSAWNGELAHISILEYLQSVQILICFKKDGSASLSYHHANKVRQTCGFGILLSETQAEFAEHSTQTSKDECTLLKVVHHLDCKLQFHRHMVRQLAEILFKGLIRMQSQIVWVLLRELKGGVGSVLLILGGGGKMHLHRLAG